MEKINAIGDESSASGRFQVNGWVQRTRTGADLKAEADRFNLAYYYTFMATREELDAPLRPAFLAVLRGEKPDSVPRLPVDNVTSFQPK